MRQPSGTCLNCGSTLKSTDKYCSNCGQRISDSRSRVSDLLSDFFVSVFNFDSRFWKSTKFLFIPGLLTQKYVEGKRKGLFAPVRLLVFLAIVHFVCLKSYIQKVLPPQYDQISQIGEWYQENAVDTVAVCLEDWWKSTYPEIDSIPSHLVALCMDTDSSESESSFIFPYFGADINLKKLVTHDIHVMSRDELFEAYGAESFMDKAILNQGIRIFVGGGRSYALFFLSNLIWVTMLTVLILGLVMYLLYLRRRRFYVEHILFQIDLHSMAFLVLAIMWLGLRFEFMKIDWIYIWLLGIVLYIWLAMKRFYQQGLFKTSVKYLIMVTSYAMISLLVFGVFLFVSLVIY